MADTLGLLVMKANGDDPAAVTTDTFRVRSTWPRLGRVARTCASSPATTTPARSRKGDLVAALSWSGDVVQLQADNANLKVGDPERTAG